ncbi:hypothetical protein BDR03DRAFT_987714 [Suillus americanus]|nr:hypothetical protein BDR03DRAFT_987714 [Suillus americanus]
MSLMKHGAVALLVLVHLQMSSSEGDSIWLDFELGNTGCMVPLENRPIWQGVLAPWLMHNGMLHLTKNTISYNLTQDISVADEHRSSSVDREHLGFLNDVIDLALAEGMHHTFDIIRRSVESYGSTYALVRIRQGQGQESCNCDIIVGRRDADS